MAIGLIFGVLSLALCAWSYFSYIHAKAQKQLYGLFMCAFFGVFGALLIAFSLLKHERGLALTAFIGIGLLFMIMGGFNLAKPLLCKLEVKGVYRAGIGSAHRRETPYFAYTVDGKEYEGAGEYGYSRKALSEKYKAGAEYPLWVWAAHPDVFTETHSVHVSDLLLCIMGLIFLLFPFIGDYIF